MPIEERTAFVEELQEYLQQQQALIEILPMSDNVSEMLNNIYWATRTTHAFVMMNLELIVDNHFALWRIENMLSTSQDLETYLQQFLLVQNIFLGLTGFAIAIMIFILIAVTWRSR